MSAYVSTIIVINTYMSNVLFTHDMETMLNEVYLMLLLIFGVLTRATFKRAYLNNLNGSKQVKNELHGKSYIYG